MYYLPGRPPLESPGGWKTFISPSHVVVFDTSPPSPAPSSYYTRVLYLQIDEVFHENCVGVFVLYVGMIVSFVSLVIT